MSRRTCLIHPVSSVLPRIGGVLTLRFRMSRFPGFRFKRADGPDPERSLGSMGFAHGPAGARGEIGTDLR